MMIDSCYGSFAGRVHLDDLAVISEYWTFVAIIPYGFCEPLNLFK